MAKKRTIFSLGELIYKLDIEEFLKQEFKPTKQLVLALYHNGTQSHWRITYEELEECTAFKPAKATSTIVGNHNLSHWEQLIRDLRHFSAWFQVWTDSKRKGLDR